MKPALRDFLTGLTTGVVVSGSLLALLHFAPQTDRPFPGDLTGATLAWIWRNLGFSLPVFGLVFALYVASLQRLKRALAASAPADEVRQADHLSDIWTSLFFGVGVVWTAIGMRGALVEALQGGATGGVQVLERMIDGGILLALSTTIFGGIGGYLMRAWKALRVGARLARYYEREGSRDLAALRASVSGIEYRLRSGHSLSMKDRP